MKNGFACNYYVLIYYEFMKTIAVLTAFICGAFVANAETYSGKVYVDSNQNGQFDAGEKLLKDVLVSDGRNVVKTTSKGEYSLSGHKRERFIFITTPSGYKSVAYYHAIEKGKYSYDFGVVPSRVQIGKNGEHSFVHISDTEISTAIGQEEWVSNLKTYAHNEHASFIIHTGDICYENGLRNHKPMMNTQNMDLPVYYCIGNHDLVKGKYGEEVFESVYGPVYYSFDSGNVHYIVTPMWGGDYRPGYTKEDVYHWLKNDLEQIPQGKPIVIFNHDYWTTGDRHVFSAGKGMEIDLDAHNLKAWIYGHVHINHITRHGKALAICTSTLARGGIDHATSAFRTIRMNRNGDISSELRYTYINKNIEIASIQNEHAPVTSEGKLQVSVNVYSTVSSTSKVSYSIRMGEKTVIPVRELKQQTDFNWSDEIKLPQYCEGKNLTLKATAEFGNGEVAIAENYFTYSADAGHKSLKGDWKNLGGNPQHVAVCSDTLDLPYSLAWIKNLGSNVYMSSPIVYDGKVFVATIDENDTGKSAVWAIDAIDGKFCWKFTTRSSVKNTIVSAQGLIFAQDVWGYLYAIDARSGKLKWEKKLNVALVPGLDDGLVATENVVFAGTGRGLCAIDVTTGRELWTNKDWSQREGTTCTLSVSTDENVLIGNVQWGAIYANDARSGKLLWAKSNDGIRFRSSSPAMHDGVMYFLSQNSLFLLSVKSGEVLTRKELPFSVEATSTPLVTSDEIIFGTAEDGLVALDRNTLNIKWKFRTGKAMIYTSPYTNGESAQIECSPVLSGDVVIVGASDGVFYAVNRKTGSLLWKHKTGAPIMSTVAVSGNLFFGVDFSGNLYCFKAR